MLIVDAHQDLAWNMLTFGRDYTLSVEEIRQGEAGSTNTRHNEESMLGWPEYQRGRVAIVFATLFATPERRKEGEWDILSYKEPRQAQSLYAAQMSAYERLTGEQPDKFRWLHTRRHLNELLACWETRDQMAESSDCAVGLVGLMEGAECILDFSELEEWWARGVRLIGPAWASNRFCGGMDEPGPLTGEGTALLEAMASLGFCLDLSHMDEQAALRVLEIYPGCVVATHSNALALLRGSDSNRHLSDRLLHGLLERDGMVGVVPFNAFLKAGWKRGDRREEVDLSAFIAQIDYICQMAGDARHVGIGSDFDGGFGRQSVPPGLESVADLQKLALLLGEKGYSQEDIAAVLGGNWITRLRQFLPESL